MSEVTYCQCDHCLKKMDLHIPTSHIRIRFKNNDLANVVRTLVRADIVGRWDAFNGDEAESILLLIPQGIRWDCRDFCSTTCFGEHIGARMIVAAFGRIIWDIQENLMNYNEIVKGDESLSTLMEALRLKKGGY